MVLFSYFHNLAMAMAFVAFVNLLSRVKRLQLLQKPWISGALLGGLAVWNITHPWAMRDGVLIDGRSLFLALAGLFGGWPSALVATLVSLPVRVAIGGPGVWAGALLILVPAAAGSLLHRHWRPHNTPRDLLRLWLFGVAVTAIYFLCLLVLPVEILRPLLAAIWLPILLLTPVFTLALGALMAMEDSHWEQQEALKASETRLRTLHDSNLDGILLLDGAEGTVLDLNPAAAAILRYDPASLRGKSAPESLGLEDGWFQEALAATRQLGHHADCLDLRLPSGPLSVEIVMVRFQEGDGTPRIWLTLRDLTIQRRREQEVRKLAEVVEQSGSSVMISDVHGRLEYVNRTFEATSGWTLAEVVGQTPAILKHPDEDPLRYRELWDAVTSGGYWQGKLRSSGRQGQTLIEHVIVFPIRDPRTGEILHIACVKRDIEKEVRLEAELHQSQKLEAIGQLAGGVAHDFNNILAIILGTAELAGERLSREGSDEDLREDVEEISRAAQRGASLTRQLLAFSRRQPLSPVRVDTAQALRSLSGMVRRLLGGSIVVEERIAPDVGAVRVDPGQLDQVLLNLCVNARDAMPEGGRLRIEVGNAARGPDFPPGDWVEILVADTGMGMSEEVQRRIFEPFFTTKEAGRGTGLGLATVLGIVQQHGGHIRVMSEPGEGTSFHIILPRDRSEEGAGAPSPAASGRGRKRLHVLLVDDDAAVLRTTRRFLEAAGHHVDAFQNPFHALERIHLRPEVFDVLVTDLSMPGMGGRELSVRAALARPGLPVLFITGVLDSLDSGAEPAQILMKPFHGRELLDQLARVVA